MYPLRRKIFNLKGGWVTHFGEGYSPYHPPPAAEDARAARGVTGVSGNRPKACGGRPKIEGGEGVNLGVTPLTKIHLSFSRYSLFLFKYPPPPDRPGDTLVLLGMPNDQI